MPKPQARFVVDELERRRRDSASPDPTTILVNATIPKADRREVCVTGRRRRKHLDGNDPQTYLPKRGQHSRQARTLSKTRDRTWLMSHPVLACRKVRRIIIGRATNLA